MADVEIGTIRRLYCNTCKAETHHEAKALHSRRYDEVEPPENAPFPQLIFWEEWRYCFWICRGCDTATLEEAYTNIAMYDPQTEDQVFESAYYPQRARRAWPQKRFRHLDAKLETMYQEVITCFNAGAKTGCAVCLRALLEGICVDKGITDQVAWGLEDKIKKLGEGNILPSNITECLLSFKFIGDDAAHRLEVPSRDEVESAIDVMEDLLNFLYEVEYELAWKAQKLAEMRSPDIERFKKRKMSDDRPERTGATKQ